MSDSNRKITEGGQHRLGTASLRRSSVVSRTIAGVSVLAVVAMLAGVACMGDDGATPTPPFVIETFTPVPPDYTPEALITRVAQQTAWAQTATAQPPVTATPPSVASPVIGTPEGTREPAGPGTPNPEDVIQPPDVFLDTDGGRTQAALGSWNWCDVRLQQCASIQFGYLILEQPSVTWTAGTAGTITIPNTSLPPESTDLALYLHDVNVVIPTNASGQVIGDDPAFVPLTDPAQEFTVLGPDIVVTPDVPPGKYILSVNVNWVLPEGARLPLYTEYAIVVEIQ